MIQFFLQIYKFTNLQIYKFTNLQIYKFTNLQIYKQKYNLLHYTTNTITAIVFKLFSSVIYECLL